MPNTILTLNAGSSSLKFALFDTGNGKACLRGDIEGLSAAAHARAHTADGTVLAENAWPDRTPFALVLNWLLTIVDAHAGSNALAAAGHRVVHGGATHVAPARVTPALLDSLMALTPLDPLHMALNIAPITALRAARPALPQIVCFDTAFHHTMPDVAWRCALPRAVTGAGVRRYGFHGLSYEYIAWQLAVQAPALARGRVIVAHLGAGASLCALQAGVSMATTMGFSALDGLMMATRCGTLDPGIILYLARQGQGLDDIEDMLYRRSGLLGVSGISGDMRVLLASGDPHAAEAIALFTYRIACEAGGLVSALGGLDGVVFTAGIGAHAPSVRAAVCARLAWLGIDIDAAANACDGRGTAGRISTPDSKITVLVIDTDEEAMIDQHTRAVMLAS